VMRGEVIGNRKKRDNERHRDWICGNHQIVPPCCLAVPPRNNVGRERGRGGGSNQELCRSREWPKATHSPRGRRQKLFACSPHLPQRCDRGVKLKGRDVFSPVPSVRRGKPNMKRGAGVEVECSMESGAWLLAEAIANKRGTKKRWKGGDEKCRGVGARVLTHEVWMI